MTKGIAPARVVAILLAAGSARRFGGDKLVTMLAGQPLVHHAAATIAAIAFARRIAIVRDACGWEPEAFGFERVATTGEAPQSASLKAGLRAAADAEAVLVALGDMPLVTVAHLRALMAAYDGRTVASACGGKAMVPAVLGSGAMARAAAIEGDRGARDFLLDGVTVAASPDMLADADTPSDVARLETIFAQRGRRHGSKRAALRLG
ncbi:nucleotidyltransferase family protein [Sphingomonas sp.]